MTGRLPDIEARIGTVHQLSTVITAMRGIAAARSREARGQLDGIRAYAAIVATAIGQALAFPDGGEQPPVAADRGGHAVIALCAEQGFAGSFNERVLGAAGTLLSGDADRLLLVGDRGLLVAQERGLTVARSLPMAAHVGQVATLAGRLIEILSEGLAAGRIRRVSVVHATPAAGATAQILRKQLLPFDFRRFPARRGAQPPLITLPPALLLARLAEEYVFAELCEALTLSFAAENEARMRAMIAARGNVDRTLDALQGRARQLRQEEITDEILELAGGVAAATER